MTSWETRFSSGSVSSVNRISDRDGGASSVSVLCIGARECELERVPTGARIRGFSVVVLDTGLLT